MKIYHLVVIALLLVFIGGCSTDSISIPKESKSKKTIKLYNQILTFPKDIKIYSYIPIKIDAINKKSILSGEYVGDDFVFNSKTSPYYIIDFQKQMIIDSVIVYNTASYLNVANNSKAVDLLSLSFALVPYNIKYPSLIYIGIGAENKLFPHKTSFKNSDKNLNVKYDVIYPAIHQPIKQMHIAIGKLHAPFFSHYKKSRLYRDYQFLIKGYSGDKVKILIEWTLKNRQKPNDNELLIRNIALSNEQLFDNLRKDFKLFKLPEYSLMKLPKDIDLRYATTHVSEIYKTRRYKNKYGKYVWFKGDSFKFNNKNIKYTTKHQVKINGKKTDTDVTANKIVKTKSNFIDFSQGL